LRKELPAVGVVDTPIPCLGRRAASSLPGKYFAALN
jgi:hypothetical protein